MIAHWALAIGVYTVYNYIYIIIYYQARSQGGFGGFDRTPPFRGVYTAQYSQYTLCHTGLAGDRVHVYTISSNVVRLAAPRLHKRARRSKRAGVCNNN